MEGSVTADGVPGIDVAIAGQSLRAVIDTGFNGDLELPAWLQSYVNPTFVGRVTSLLAANQQVEENLTFPSMA